MDEGEVMFGESRGAVKLAAFLAVICAIPAAFIPEYLHHSHAHLFSGSISLTVFLTVWYGARWFLSQTDIDFTYGLRFIPHYGWYPTMRIQSAPSARKYTLGNILVTRKGKIFGQSYETMLDIDNSIMHTEVWPGTFQQLQPEIQMLPQSRLPQRCEPTPQFVKAMKEATDGVSLVIQTEGRHKFQAHGVGNPRPLWVHRLYVARRWLDKHILRPA